MRTMMLGVVVLWLGCGGADKPAPTTTPETPDERDEDDATPVMSDTAEKTVSDFEASPPMGIEDLQTRPFAYAGTSSAIEPAPDAERDEACAAFWRDVAPFVEIWMPAYETFATKLRDLTLTAQDALDYLIELNDHALEKLEPVRVTYEPLVAPYQNAVRVLLGQRDALAEAFEHAERGDEAAAKTSFDQFVELFRETDSIGEPIVAICPMPGG